MTMPRLFKRSPLALAILALLDEAPMHPYRMQRLIKDRGGRLPDAGDLTLERK